MIQRQTSGLESMKWKYFFLVTGSLAAYLCVGAVIFRATERNYEKGTRKKLQKAYELFLAKYNCVDESKFMEFTEAYFQSGLHSSKGYIRDLRLVNTTDLIWDFPGSLNFALTVITTIGYGHVYPNSALGRGLCIIYALFGIPLTLIFLGAVGDKMIHVASRIGRLKWSSRSPDLNHLINMAVIVMTGMVVMFLLPSVVFHLIEGWSYSRALYYCFITLSTIGFGDDVAGLVNNNMSEELHHVYKAFVYLWILVGLSYLSVVIKFIIHFYIRKADNVKKRVTITMLRGRRQRVVLNKKKFANDQLIRDLLCTDCFDKLQRLADKGHQLDKLFSYQSKYIQDRMQREHSILRRSKTVADMQVNPADIRGYSAKTITEQIPHIRSMPNLGGVNSETILNPENKSELNGEETWEISVEEFSKDPDSEGELVTLRVFEEGGGLPAFGQDNPVFEHDDGDFRVLKTKTQGLEDITFKFAHGLLTKGHSFSNVYSASQGRKSMKQSSKSFKHKKSPLSVIFGDTQFAKHRFSRKNHRENKSHKSPSLSHKGLGSCSVVHSTSTPVTIENGTETNHH